MEMSLLYSVILVVLGIPILLFGGERVVTAAVRIANLYKVSPAIVAVTIIAFGTSSPEAIVSVLASLKGSANIAVANVIASNIINIALVLGITLLFVPVYSPKKLLRWESFNLIFSALLICVFMYDKIIMRWEALILVAVCLGFTYSMIRLAKKQNKEHLEKNTIAENNITMEEREKTLLHSCLLLLFGFILLFLGGETVLSGSINLAQKMGLSERIIGLTVVAIGTSLPEVATSIVAIVRKKHGVALGAVIGSNIYNIVAVLGLAGIMNPLNIDPSILSIDIIPFLAYTFLLVFFMYFCEKLPRSLGGLFISGWVLYTYILFVQ